MKTTSRAVAAALVAAFAVVLVRTAWVSDDAYITLRVLDNAVNGFGLRWNVAERVQVYTHPLWMLVLLPLYAITREPFFTTLALGAAFSLAAVGAIAWRWRDDPWTAAAAIVPLIVSRAFMDYSTSGLENPLTHLLLVAFVFLLPEGDVAPDRRRMALLGTVAGLLMLNRLDAVLLVGPALAWAAWRRGLRSSWREVGVGFLPLAAWTAFSVVYYGLPYPNTALAKLATGIPAGELWEQGLRYLGESIRHDPSTLAATVAATVAAAAFGGRRGRLLAAGAGLYLLYTVKIGGDFMSGRFLAAPLLVALLAGASAAGTLKWGRTALAGGTFLLAFAAPFTNFTPGATLATHRSGVLDPSGIADERRYYFSFQGWWNGVEGRSRPLRTASRAGRSWREAGSVLDVNGAVGAQGYYAGPGLHLVDHNALTDPLLSRLPMVQKDPSFAAFRAQLGMAGPAPPWRIGHFARRVPAGYLATLLSGENRIEDPAVRELWRRVEIVTRGPIWSGERWRYVLTWLFDGGKPGGSRTPFEPVRWSEALELKPRDAGLLQRRAASRMNDGDAAGALGDLALALEVDPDNVEALLLAVRAEVQAGDLAAAGRFAERAVRADPGDDEARLILGWSRAAVGDLRGAIEAGRSALGGDPVIATAARAAIGRWFLLLGDAASASAWLREAVEADPGNPEWRQLLDQAKRGGRR